MERPLPEIVSSPSLEIYKPLDRDNLGILAHLRRLLGTHSSCGVILFDSVSRNPNGEGLPRWPEYNQEEGYLQIGANTQAAQKLKDKEVAFWTTLFAKKAVEKPPQTEHIEL